MAEKSSDDRLARYVVIALAIVGLVFVAWVDLLNEADVNNIVYWTLAGAILGAENIVNLIKK